jgi:NTE family protein
MMLGLNLENTTTDDFRIALTGRYLAFDVFGSGSEVRIDGTLGSDPSLATELYRPIRASAFFVAPYAGIFKRNFNVIAEDSVVARYGQTVTRLGVNFGVNLGRLSDFRVGVYLGRLDADVAVGNPGLPALKGKELVTTAMWRYDRTDSPVVPSTGTATHVTMQYIVDGPDITPPLPTARSSVRLTQLSGEAVTFKTLRERNRLFVLTGMGTSFRDSPLPIDQFSLGSPFHLGAYNVGELLGDHYYIATGGYLRQIARLPDFLGGPVFIGGWLELGDAFDDLDQIGLRSQASAGVVMDTLIGPVLLAGTAGFDGRWRTYVGVGRIFGQ